MKSLSTIRSLSLLALLAVGPRLVAAEADALWTAVDGGEAALDLVELDMRLARTPLEFTIEAERPMPITLPLPDGTLARFELVESPVMMPGLQAAYPEIRTYAGVGLDDRTATMRLIREPRGVTALVLSADRTISIEPVDGDDTAYVSQEITLDRSGFRCGTPPGPGTPVLDADGGPMSAGGPVEVPLRQFTLAIVATSEYTTWAGGTRALAMGRIVTTLTRINTLWEREVGIRFRVPDEQIDLIFLHPDPFTDEQLADPCTALDRNQEVLDANINAGAYQVGHLFHRVDGSGDGCATLSCTCVETRKGRGATFHPNPGSVAYALGWVSHELAHQFGANHSWNGARCSAGQRNQTTAFEPGSGTTIMSYCGVCGNDNIISNPDYDDTNRSRGPVAYFHGFSGSQIRSHTVFHNGCGDTIPFGNNRPDPGSLTDYDLPKGTPFTLTASATDPDGDQLTFCWEQKDVGAAAAFLEAVDDGQMPLFRSFTPTTMASRTFPRWSQLLGKRRPPWERQAEQLPNQGRHMAFTVMVRDNQGGRLGASNTYTVRNDAGPFRVTSPNGGEELDGAITVTWSVANTTAVPISVANVRIRLSTDGGESFPTDLAVSTPNDGSQVVTLPGLDVETRKARIMIQAIGNVFFDISDEVFEIPAQDAHGCCLPDGTCVQASEFGCAALSGIWGPPDSICAGDEPAVDVIADNFDGPCLAWGVETNDQMTEFNGFFEDGFGSRGYTIDDITIADHAWESGDVDLFRAVDPTGAYRVQWKLQWDEPLGNDNVIAADVGLYDAAGVIIGRVGIVDEWAHLPPEPVAEIAAHGRTTGNSLPFNAGNGMWAELRVRDCPGGKRIVALFDGKLVATGTTTRNAATLRLRVRRWVESNKPLLPFGEVHLDVLALRPYTPCPADLDFDGVVGFSDVLVVLAGWGETGDQQIADIDCDDAVTFADLLEVLAAWGACP